jgi:hypothetical protein
LQFGGGAVFGFGESGEEGGVAGAVSCGGGKGREKGTEEGCDLVVNLSGCSLDR